MSGDDRDDRTYDQPQIPAALRERIEELFVEYRGYEPATFQESLSLVADLAAARIEAEAEGAADAVDSFQEAQPEPAGDAADGDAAASAQAGSEADAGAVPPAEDPGAEAHAEPVAGTSTEVVDDASEERFAELEDDAAARPGADAPTDAAASGAGQTDLDDDIPESLRADPESNCALCGEVHPVSVLETTIPEDADSIALVCPACAE